MVSTEKERRGERKISRNKANFPFSNGAFSFDYNNAYAGYTRNVKGEKEMMKVFNELNNKKGMEMVQVGILIAIAVGIGIIFKTQITEFVNGTFSTLMNSGF